VGQGWSSCTRESQRGWHLEVLTEDREVTPLGDLNFGTFRAELDGGVEEQASKQTSLLLKPQLFHGATSDAGSIAASFEEVFSRV